jgi:hypothetical protein
VKSTYWFGRSFMLDSLGRRSLRPSDVFVGVSLIPSNASGKRGLQKVIELTCVRECIAVWKPLVGVVRGLEVR